MNAAPPVTTSAPLPERARILCIRLSALGDTLLTLPAVDALRAKYPAAHIGFLTDTRQAGLLRASRSIDEVLTIDRHGLRALRPGALGRLSGLLGNLRRGRWDAVIDFQAYTETALLARLTGAPIRLGRRYKTNARGLYTRWIDEPHPEVYMPFAHLDSLSRAGLIEEVAPGPLGRYLTIPAEVRTRWEVTHAGLGLPPTEMSPRVGLFVGAAEERRRWPASRFAELAVGLDAATELPLSFLVFAGPDEQAVAAAVVRELEGSPLSDHVRSVPTESLLALGAALEDCVLTVSNDTGPLHLSVGLGTPTCGIHRRGLAHFMPPAPHCSVLAPERDISRIAVDDVLLPAATLLHRY